jgi:lysophospholipase L1-like esterase
MNKLLLVVLFVVLALSWPAYRFYLEYQRAVSDDPLVWAEVVAAFEERDARGENPRDPVVFVGSSSIRLWDTLAADMAPVPVVQRGFGGAKLNDVVYYAERLVSVHRPSAVVIFAGTNDISPGASKSPETLLASYREFVAKVRAEQADLPIYFIAITPSQLRWEVWPVAQRTNELIRAYSQRDDNLHVIDTGAALLGEDGTPDPDNYMIDRLHLSEQGYAIWTRLIRPHVLAYAP